MAETGEKKKWTARSILFMALTWLVVVLLIEAEVRIFQPESGHTIYAGYPSDLVVANDSLGHVYQPGFSGYFPNPMYSDIPITTNSHGFRDSEWTKEKQRPRILVLGDSITFGSPLRKEERFTEQAEDFLKERGHDVEFLNLGVNGYGMIQYQRLLEQMGKELSPDIVLIGYCLNDAEPLSPSDARQMELAEGIASGDGLAKLRASLMKYRLDPGKSYAWNLLTRTANARLWGSEKFGAVMAKRYNEKTRADLVQLYTNGDGKQRLKKHLAVMKDFASTQLNAQLGAVLFVYHHQIKEKNPELIKAAGEVFSELNIPTVDLYETFLKNADAEDLYAYRDDCHPGAPGHQLAGKKTAMLVEKMLSQQASR